MELATVRGQGTAFTLWLPMSVAILRALLVRVASETYAIPLSLVHSTARRADHVDPTGDPATVLVNGLPLRVVSLRSHLGIAARDDVCGHLVVLDGNAGRFALLVDACLAQQEIVVKPLQRVRGAASRFSGGTILSDGMPSLILDINSLN
jgi:two-component system, chemotaxis family, sensor kinase CheA